MDVSMRNENCVGQEWNRGTYEGFMLINFGIALVVQVVKLFIKCVDVDSGVALLPIFKGSEKKKRIERKKGWDCSLSCPRSGVAFYIL